MTKKRPENPLGPQASCGAMRHLPKDHRKGAKSMRISPPIYAIFFKKKRQRQKAAGSGYRATVNLRPSDNQLSPRMRYR